MLIKHAACWGHRSLFVHQTTRSAPIVYPALVSLESDGLREKKVQNVNLQQQRGLTSTTAPDLQGGHFEASLFKKKTKKKNRRRRKLTWEDKFAFLREFKKMFHHTEVPPGYIVNGFNLHGWVDTQRKEYLKYRFGAFSLIINERRIKRLGDRIQMEPPRYYHGSR